ncbi:MAG TPA: hypothetical protein VIM86_09320 [Thermodesulfobacteriota bacterium]
MPPPLAGALEPGRPPVEGDCGGSGRAVTGGGDGGLGSPIPPPAGGMGGRGAVGVPPNPPDVGAGAGLGAAGDGWADAAGLAAGFGAAGAFGLIVLRAVVVFLVGAFFFAAVRAVPLPAAGLRAAVLRAAVLRAGLRAAAFRAGLRAVVVFLAGFALPFAAALRFLGAAFLDDRLAVVFAIVPPP